MHTRSTRAAAAAAALAFVLAGAACVETTSIDPDFALQGNVVVVHATGSLKGISVNDTAAAGPRYALPVEFDAGGMRLERDTLVTTSSSFGTNRVYLFALPTGPLREAEMPAGADPSGAALVRGFQGAQVGAALRNSRQVALVRFAATGVPTTTFLQNVARCPYDLAEHDGALWVVDHNAACEGSFATLGDSRLIRVGENGTARDTVALPGVPFATGITVRGDLAYVASFGVADYSQFPTTRFVTSPTITVVNLRTRQIVRSATLPPNTLGASLSFGRDGVLYVQSYVSTAFDRGVFALDPATLAFRGTRETGRETLRLAQTGGTQAQCHGVDADESGRIYCAVNLAQLGTTEVVVFSPAGVELRRFRTQGTGAVALALR